MKTSTTLLLLTSAMLLLASSCIVIEEPQDVVHLCADLEVEVVDRYGYLAKGVEVTIYHTYEDALYRTNRFGRLYTDHYGIVLWPELSVGHSYFVRAQVPHGFSLGSVFIDREGLFVIPMELP